MFLVVPSNFELNCWAHQKVDLSSPSLTYYVTSSIKQNIIERTRQFGSSCSVYLASLLGLENDHVLALLFGCKSLQKWVIHQILSAASDKF